MKFYINSTISTTFGTIGRGWHETALIAQKYNVAEDKIKTLVESLVITDMAVLEEDKLKAEEKAQKAEAAAKKKFDATQKKEAPKGAKVDTTKTATADGSPETKTATTK